MKTPAVVIHRAHDLRIEDVDVSAPGPGEVRVRIGAGGICGSDLHYFHEGRIGSIVVREPMILGHEVAGTILEVGSGVESLKIGDRVAVSPSRPCGSCRFCHSGHQQHCLDMRFYGSAMRMPHVQGAFRGELVALASQCHVIAPEVSIGEAAMAEPLSVCLHAGHRAGALLGRRVLVTGAGPIGQLSLLVARQAGAAEVVVTDLASPALDMATRLGATRAINVATEPEALRPYAVDKGHFDVLFECSGSEKALIQAFDVLRPGARIVQIGLGGPMTLPINLVVAKELEICGTFRFHGEFGHAVELIGRRRIDVRPLITETVSYREARRAFELASDRTRAMKVQLAFSS